ncbi:MAG: conjugal transfer protein TraX [bacterium]|nr:conjugal transfer protein TraX [bacterium]MCM1374352.1 conjugal transfer protein TraX [Muribaculum sp.]
MKQKIEKRLGLSGSTLKFIAMFTMLIDHIGAMVVLRCIVNMQRHLTDIVTYSRLLDLYRVMRGIGRIAFPIYCFLLVEGFLRTHNLKKYILRLSVFALLSEIPFDLCLTSKVISLSHQSVMLTLLIGVITMWGVSWLERHVQNRIVLVCGSMAVIAVGAATAELLHTDYGYMGVACIMVLYALRRIKWMQIAGGCLVFLWEIWAPLAFIPIGFYNGKRGLKLKYVFYLFYPAHLLTLYLICVLMGTARIPVV